MSSLFSRLAFTGSARVTSGLLGVSLVAIGTAIYLTPTSGGKLLSTPRTPGPATTVAPPAAPAVAALVPKPRPAHTPTPSHGRGHSGPTPLHVIRPPARTDVVVVKERQPGTVRTRVQVANARIEHCWDFHWQQDAQAAYLANLSDPGGLDGAPGPYNGDGLACTQLPVDPSRPASTPVGAYAPPSPADKASLVHPTKRYFGVAEDGLPGDDPLYDQIARQTGKTPSAVEWFSYWSTDYESDKVQAAWSRGALPVITWMSEAEKSSAPDAGDYTLANVVAGRFDSYLLRYAGAVLRTGLPVAIRLDHEMNGNWYPWSAGLPVNQATSAGQPNLYVQAWQHIWNVFQSVGANADVIWIWAPVRVDNINPHSTTKGFKYETALDEDYPGDDYVDWVGTSAYEYKPTDGWSYENTFRKTFDALGALTAKPVFVAETGATQTVNGTDYTAGKAQWTSQTLAGLASEPNVVGFAWFNNTVNDVHQVDGVPIQTDWQFSSSPAALAAFRAGIANPVFASGNSPDGGDGD